MCMDTTKSRHVYECPVCAGRDLQIPMWVNMNTHEVVDAVEPPSDAWCADCNDFVREKIHYE